MPHLSLHAEQKRDRCVLGGVLAMNGRSFAENWYVGRPEESFGLRKGCLNLKYRKSH